MKTGHTGVMLAFLLAGCTSLSVKAPDLDLPPIPDELTARCEEPILPQGPTFADMYTNAIQNAVGPWRRCVSKDDALIAVVKYRDSVLAKWKAENSKQAKPWWQIF